jgi:L-aspartate oxidase
VEATLSSVRAADSVIIMNTPDYIVLGSGVAGLRAAIELAGDGRVAVLTKDRLDESNTEYAQGGVAVAMSDDDEISLHVEDTLNAGAGLCDEHAVRVLVEEGPRYITELIEWGAQFDREGGSLQFTQEAAHSRRRILHANGDSTGREIVRALIAHARKQSNIQLIAHAATIGLIVEDGRCSGVRFIDPNESLRRELRSRAVVLATGGAGQIFAQTTNPSVATGDGMAMAYAAGAEMLDLEFTQFHPTALALEDAPRFLLSEALRGEGGILRNHDGEAFARRYDDRGELAPRDIVARAIVAEMERTLDVSGPDSSQGRFPARTIPQYLRDMPALWAGFDEGSLAGESSGPLCDGWREYRHARADDAGGLVRGGRGGMHWSAWREPPGQQFPARRSCLRSAGRRRRC